MALDDETWFFPELRAPGELQESGHAVPIWFSVETRNYQNGVPACPRVYCITDLGFGVIGM
jgi:hypothetical protein